jgi:hypothetical protein
VTGTGRDLRRAYSKLGLELGADRARVRQRYRDLAKRWHPDRYAADPRGQAEAAAQMREINDAYREVIAHVRTVAGRRAPHGAPLSRGRLSREEIDSYVQTLGSSGPIDTLMDGGRSLLRPLTPFVAGMCILSGLHVARWLDVSPGWTLPIGVALAIAVLALLRRPD